MSVTSFVLGALFLAEAVQNLRENVEEKFGRKKLTFCEKKLAERSTPERKLREKVEVKNVGRVVKEKFGKKSDKTKRTKTGKNIEANVKESFEKSEMHLGKS